MWDEVNKNRWAETEKSANTKSKRDSNYLSFFFVRSSSRRFLSCSLCKRKTKRNFCLFAERFSGFDLERWRRDLRCFISLFLEAFNITTLEANVLSFLLADYYCECACVCARISRLVSKFSSKIILYTLSIFVGGYLYCYSPLNVCLWVCVWEREKGRNHHRRERFRRIAGFPGEVNTSANWTSIKEFILGNYMFDL